MAVTAPTVPALPSARVRGRAAARATSRHHPLVELADELAESTGRALRALAPSAVLRLEEEIEERLARVPLRKNEYGYDPWGFHPAVARRILLLTSLFYRYYFRVELAGVERLPAGRVLVVANHGGQIALDAAMIATGVFLEGEPPRILRGMGEYWLPRVPWINIVMVRSGSVVGTPKNCLDLLHRDEAVIVFPEGVRGMNKPYWQAYRLQRFGLGFMRLALATRTPIVPVAVVGSEEQAPGIANLRSVARLLGMPAFPLTLTWPWLGPLGLVPFPVKYRITFGEPMEFSGDAHAEDEAIEKLVRQVKRRIRTMLDRMLEKRKTILSIFF
ncbi:MAG: hypothetical protein KatS3mg076_1181 [Candidatus Binatia bacterium]|nr:MAG: hypothetical protein KatS3mg076_1181 [Candidatus Binatia bacterium]